MSTTEEKRQVYMDSSEGLLYYASEGGTTMELAGEKLLVKYRASKFIDWKTLSDMLFKEMSDLAEWGFRQMENKVESLSPIGREKRRQDAYLPFFIDDEGWVMYANDDSYLFVYEVDFSEQPQVSSATDFASICYLPMDALGNMTTFLTEWYMRTHGYPECRE